MKSSFIVLSLGCDIFAPPGSSITGGQAVFTKNLINELAKKYSTTIVSLRFGDNEEPLSNTDEYQFDIIEIPLDKNEYNNESLWDKFSEIERKCLKSISSVKFKSSFVISIYWLSGLLISRNKQLKPKIWMHTFASFATQKTTEYNNAKYLSIRLETERTIGNKVDYLWATNKYEHDLLQHKYSFCNSKILVIPRAVSQGIFGKLPGIKYYRWDVIFFGRLDKRKGVYDIPVTLKHIKNRRKISLLIIGGTEKEIHNYKKWFAGNYPNIVKHHNILFWSCRSSTCPCQAYP